MKKKILSTLLALTLSSSMFAQTALAVKMYAPNGKTAVISKTAVEDWKKVGWYDTKSITMYAADGRTKDVPISEIEYRKSVGWYENPVVTEKKNTTKTTTSSSSSISYYYDCEQPFPKYDSIINSEFIRKDRTTGIYIYEYTNSTDFTNYIEYLTYEGWSRYDSKTDYEKSSFTAYMRKGSKLISIVAALKYNEVWIIFQ